MEGEVRVEETTGQLLVGQSSVTKRAEVSKSVMALLSEVWQKIHSAQLRTLGINVFIYGYGGPQSGQSNAERLDIFAGVVVSEGTQVPSGLEAGQTPTGRVAHLVHYGDYGQLGVAHRTVADWCRIHHQKTTGISWEVYGHHDDDPAKRRTDIYYQLQE